MTRRHPWGENVSRFKDRHGKWRYRFRKKGRVDHYMQAEFNTPDYWVEHEACVRGEKAPRIEPGKSRTRPGSINDLVARYYISPEFTGLAESSKRTFRGIIERFRLEHGDKRVRLIERRHVKAIIGRMADRPAAANKLLDRLKVLFEVAIDEGMRRDNPARGVHGFKLTSEGFYTWTEEDIAQYEKVHPSGTPARLAMSLMLNTAQRRSDAVRMGPQHVSGNYISVAQKKTHARLEIPLHPDLAVEIEQAPKDCLAFILTAYGKPFSEKGFGNRMRKWCDDAGLPQCTSHGLRKAASRRLAEAGCTHEQIKAITGHKTDKEVSHYVAAADQKRLADEAQKRQRRHSLRVKKGTKLANQNHKGSQNEG